MSEIEVYLRRERSAVMHVVHDPADGQFVATVTSASAGAIRGYGVTVEDAIAALDDWVTRLLATQTRTIGPEGPTRVE
ncbi:HicB-like antitoxin [Gordonia phage VanLee]|uniref:HicB-like antitoxin n=1 Tax=Gordonia phage VanLee TaxID=2845816 RepID=A0A8F2D9R3_9CAUD|nr:HicB-like antitoxin [Gordonia phage VanLee]QWS68218.1 HicB-like antitoxin [Gordonia phage VanLee]